jgi:hypothetical protein
MLPGLLFGAASIAKEQGLFGTPSLTPQEMAGNNAVWARLGQRPQMEQEGPQMADIPQATPGLSLAGSAPRHAMLPPMSVGAPQRPPQPQQWAPPQAPVAGLLSDPNEQQRRAFFQSQGIGPAAQFAMR